ncbi:MAG: HNH endonuclease [Acetobacteraceae bacterium]
MSLPEAPLARLRKATAGLRRTTEAEREVIARIGQSVFRDALLAYWHGSCPMSGITEPALLRASHIVPWSECQSAALRLDRLTPQHRENLAWHRARYDLSG